MVKHHEEGEANLHLPTFRIWCGRIWERGMQYSLIVTLMRRLLTGQGIQQAAVLKLYFRLLQEQY